MAYSPKHTAKSPATWSGKHIAAWCPQRQLRAGLPARMHVGVGKRVLRPGLPRGSCLLQDPTVGVLQGEVLSTTEEVGLAASWRYAATT